MPRRRKPLPKNTITTGALVVAPNTLDLPATRVMLDGQEWTVTAVRAYRSSSHVEVTRDGACKLFTAVPNGRRWTLAK